jgi:hypothetical protein
VLWTGGSKVKVIEEEAFEDTQLNQLEIRGSLQYIGAWMCPARRELLLTKESANRRFEKWKASFLQNRTHVMGLGQKKRVNLNQESLVQLCKQQELISSHMTIYLST